MHPWAWCLYSNISCAWESVYCPSPWPLSVSKGFMIIWKKNMTVYPADEQFSYWCFPCVCLNLHVPFHCTASKEDLIPPVPILTRYRKEAGIKAFVKKELFDTRAPDETITSEISVLETKTLCVQLNTLYVSSR